MRLRTQGPETALFGGHRERCPTRYGGQAAEDVRVSRRHAGAEELRALTSWKVHTLTGDRKGTWSLSVTRNRRLTFTIDDEREICDVNLEDYH